MVLYKKTKEDNCAILDFRHKFLSYYPVTTLWLACPKIHHIVNFFMLNCTVQYPVRFCAQSLLVPLYCTILLRQERTLRICA